MKLRQIFRHRRLRISAVMLLAGFLLSGSLSQVAEACPLCKAAAEEDSAQAKAYMYSILFMLTVPGLIIGGLTAGLIRLGRREARAMQEYELQHGGFQGAHSRSVASQERELMEV